MSKNPDKYRLLIENLPDAFAYHQIIYNQHGEPEDYIFQEVNAAFEVMTGLKRKDVIGKKASEVLPDLKRDSFNWIAAYGRLALEGGRMRFESFSEQLRCHYDVTAYSNEKNYFVTVFRDITESKQQEIEMLNNQKRFSQAQLFAIMGTWEYSLAEGKLYWSNECADLFGIKPEEFGGDFEAFLAFVHPEDREYVIQTNQPAVELKEGMVLRYEHRIVRKDGTVRWVREEAGPVADEDGIISKMVGMVIDITEQRGVETLLREKNEQLRGILESQQDLIVRVDLAGRFLYINDAYCKKFGRDRQDLLGKPFTPLIHPEDLESTKKAMEALFREPYRAYMEQRAMTTEGWRWIAWEDSAICDENGKVIEIQGVGRDITAWKDAEVELRNIQANLESIVLERTKVLEETNLRLQQEMVQRELAEASLRYHNSQLKLLFEVSKKIAAEKELTPLAQNIVDSIAKLTGLKSVALYLLDDDNIRLEATYPMLPPDFPESLRLASLADHPHISKSITDRQPVILADTQKADLTTAEKEVCDLRQLRSILYVPIVYQGKSTGVLIVSSVNERYEFTKEDIEISQALAGMAALALAEAHLKEAQQNYITEIEKKSIALEQAEKRDMKSKQRVADILRHAENVAFVTTDLNLPEPRILDFSYGAEQIFGYTKEEILGENVSILHTPEDVKQFPTVIEAMKHNKSGFSGESVLIRKGGYRFPALFKTHPLFDEHGSMWGTFGVSVDITERKQAEEKLADTLEVCRRGLEGIIISMGTMMGKRDNYTASHQLRVANLSVIIAGELGLEKTRIEGLKLAAEVHDIGKIGIPAEILTKPGELSNLEYMIIQTHPHAGYEILNTIDFPWPLADIIAQHHEKIDGSGYPEGLRGDQILLEAKIICVADVVEAMASHRPYRASRGIDAALEEIERQRGILFDESVVDACLSLFREKGFKLEQ
jgi:PAS domain S-box-containing protein/putative nucleotidyltransferase with HDIG domain